MKDMIGRLTTRQFQALQTRLGTINESERYLMLYRQIEMEIEEDLKEANEETDS